MPFGNGRNGNVCEALGGLEACDRDQDEIRHERSARNGFAEIGEQQLFGAREKERKVPSLSEAPICEL